MVLTKKYKLINPLKPDEFIKQEVIISDRPQLSYEHADWVAIDTEFLSLDLAQDNLCVIQIASPHPDNKDLQQIEIIWVYDSELEAQKLTADLLKKFLNSEDLTIIMHLATADLPRIEGFANKFSQEDTKLLGKLFDTKVASKIIQTNINKHGLGNLIQSLIDPHFNKDNNQTSSQWDIAPEHWNDPMIQYATLDVYYLAALKQRLTQIALRRNKAELVERIMESIPAITELYKYGLTESVIGY